MLRQLYIILFILVLLSCKQDSMDLASANLISIAGTWRLTEVEKGSYGQKFWEAAVSASRPDLVFREDGYIVDKDGLPICCGPNALLINQQLFKIEPNKSITANPVCALVNCAPCPEWEITYQGGTELIILYCDGAREKYTRL